MILSNVTLDIPDTQGWSVYDPDIYAVRIKNATTVAIEYTFDTASGKNHPLVYNEFIEPVSQKIYFRVMQNVSNKKGAKVFITKGVQGDVQKTSLQSIDARTGILDSFNRLRVSMNVKLFDAQLEYDMQPIFWHTKLVGNATATHDEPNSAADLNVLGEGDKVVRQTFHYRYQAGDGQAIKMTYTPTLHSDSYFVVRSTASGSVEENKIHQNDPLKSTDGVSVWNVDSFDGTGDSRIDMDKDKSQILFVDLEWLSVGTVSFGIFVDRKLQYGHMQHHANKIRGAYMTTANLPLRYEIEVIDGDLVQRVGYFDNKNGVYYEMVTPNTTSGVLKQICNSIDSEGGVTEEPGVPGVLSSGAAPVILGAGETIYAGARHALLYNGIENRGAFIPKTWRVGSTDEQLYVRIVYNPTVVGGTWEQIEENGYISIMESAPDITSISGGLTIDDDNIYATSQANRSSPDKGGNSITSKLPFGLDIDGQNPVNIVMEITNIGSTTTEVTYGAKFIEVR